MYSRKKIPAPFGKTQKTAEKKKEATTVLPQKETSKEPIFLHAEEKTIPQGGSSPVLVGADFRKKRCLSGVCR